VAEKSSSRKSSGSYSPRSGKKEASSSSSDLRSPRTGRKKEPTSLKRSSSSSKRHLLTIPKVSEKKDNKLTKSSPSIRERRKVQQEAEGKKRDSLLGPTGGSKRGSGRMKKFQPKRRSSNSDGEDVEEKKGPPPPPPEEEKFETPVQQVQKSSSKHASHCSQFSEDEWNSSSSSMEVDKPPCTPATPSRKLSSSSRHGGGGDSIPSSRHGGGDKETIETSVHRRFSSKEERRASLPPKSPSVQNLKKAIAEEESSSSKIPSKTSREKVQRNELEETKSFARLLWEDSDNEEEEEEKEAAKPKEDDSRRGSRSTSRRSSAGKENNDLTSPRGGRRIIRATNTSNDHKSRDRSVERNRRTSARDRSCERTRRSSLEDCFSSQNSATSSLHERRSLKKNCDRRISSSSHERPASGVSGSRPSARDRLSSTAHGVSRQQQSQNAGNGFDVVAPSQSRWSKLKTFEPVDGFNNKISSTAQGGGGGTMTTLLRTLQPKITITTPTPGAGSKWSNLRTQTFATPNPARKCKSDEDKMIADAFGSATSKWTKLRYANDFVSSTKRQAKESKYNSNAFGSPPRPKTNTFNAFSGHNRRSSAPNGIDAPNTITQKERNDRKQESSSRKSNILASLLGVLDESDPHEHTKPQAKLEVKNGTTRIGMELGDAPPGLLGTM
jgi:hypothetical protein